MTNFMNAAISAAKGQFWNLVAPVMVGAVVIAVVRAFLNK